MTIGDLQAKTRNLRERLVAHAEFHIGGENDSVALVGLAGELVDLAAGLAGELVDLANKLAAASTLASEPVTPAADAALQEANAIAVIIGQFPRMMTRAEYHSRLAEHGRRLRVLLDDAGYPAPGSVPTPEGAA